MCFRFCCKTVQKSRLHCLRSLWPPSCVIGQTIIFSSCGFFFFLLLLSFFFAHSQPSEIGCLPYFHTWCGLSANLERMSEMCSTRLAENTRRKKSPKIRHLGTIAQLCLLYLRNWGMHLQLETNLLNSNISSIMSSQYGELWPISGWARFTSLGHPRKFQRVSRVSFVTGPTSLTGGQPNFAGRLAVSWVGILLYTFSGALAP